MLHPCILVVNDGELESYLLVNMQWSFQMVQDCLQLSKNVGNIERWYYFMSLLQILLWAKSNIRWCQPFATETSSALNAYLPSKLFFLNGVQGKFFCGIFSDAIASQVVQDWSSHQARSRILKPVTKIINANDEPSLISKNISSILRGCCEDDEMVKRCQIQAVIFFSILLWFCSGRSNASGLNQFCHQTPPFWSIENLQHMTVSEYHFVSLLVFCKSLNKNPDSQGSNSQWALSA